MKQLISIYRNWRCTTLIVLAALAFLLAVAESNSLLALVASKLLALALVVLVASLFTHWVHTHKIDELAQLEE